MNGQQGRQSICGYTETREDNCIEGWKIFGDKWTIHGLLFFFSSAGWWSLNPTAESTICNTQNTHTGTQTWSREGLRKILVYTHCCFGYTLTHAICISYIFRRKYLLFFTLIVEVIIYISPLHCKYYKKDYLWLWFSVLF